MSLVFARSAHLLTSQRRQHPINEHYRCDNRGSRWYTSQCCQHLQPVSLAPAPLPYVNSAFQPNDSLYIALSFGFSLAVNAWIFFRVSGGLFNPAVSLGMVLVGALTPLRGALLTFSQILGGITVRFPCSHHSVSSDKQGAAIIYAITPGTLNVRTTLGGGATVVQGLFIEMFLTSL